MKRFYFGFNWDVSPLTGQFGLFYFKKDYYRYVGFGFFSMFILLLWILLSKEESEYIIGKKQRDKNE